ELQCRAGPVVEKRLIRLGENDVHEELGIRLEFPSAAPLDGTSTSHEYHQQAAVEASAAVAREASSPEDAGLVILLRNLRGRDDLPLDPGQLRLFDEKLEPVAGFDNRWRFAGEDRCAAWAGRLPPGGYALRSGR